MLCIVCMIILRSMDTAEVYLNQPTQRCRAIILTPTDTTTIIPISIGKQFEHVTLNKTRQQSIENGWMDKNKNRRSARPQQNAQGPTKIPAREEICFISVFKSHNGVWLGLCYLKKKKKMTIFLEKRHRRNHRINKVDAVSQCYGSKRRFERRSNILIRINSKSWGGVGWSSESYHQQFLCHYTMQFSDIQDLVN